MRARQSKNGQHDFGGSGLGGCSDAMEGGGEHSLVYLDVESLGENVQVRWACGCGADGNTSYPGGAGTALAAFNALSVALCPVEDIRGSVVRYTFEGRPPHRKPRV